MENSRQGSRFHGAPNPIFPRLPASFKAKVDFGLDFHLAGADAVPPQRLVWLIIPSFLSWVLRVCASLITGRRLLDKVMIGNC